MYVPVKVKRSTNRKSASRDSIEKMELFLWKYAVIGENIKTTRYMETNHNGLKRNSAVGCKLSFAVTKYSGTSLFEIE